MPDKSLDDRTDEHGHVTPSQDDAQRAADIDEQVRRAREGEVSVGGNTVEPGQYGPDSIPSSDTQVHPKPDGQTEEEARARSEAIDAQVAGATAVGVETGVQTSAPTQEGAVAEAKLDEGDDLSDLTVPQLRALAKDRDVKLGGASTKDDIIAAIETADQ